MRPLGTSSDNLLPVDGRLGSGDGCPSFADISFESLLRSIEGRAKNESLFGPSWYFEEELEGRVGGEGGAWPPLDWVWPPGGYAGCSQFKEGVVS